MRVSYFRGSDIRNAGLSTSEIFSSIVEENDELISARFFYFRTKSKGILIAADDQAEVDGAALFLIDVSDRKELQAMEDDISNSQVIENFLSQEKVMLLRKLLRFIINEKNSPVSLNDAAFLSILVSIPSSCFERIEEFSDLDLVKLSLINNAFPSYNDLSLDELKDKTRTFNEFIL